MDPNQCLKDIEEYLYANIGLKLIGAADLTIEINIWCKNLYDWLDNEGFEPDWDKYPTGTAYYNKIKSALGRVNGCSHGC